MKKKSLAALLSGFLTVCLTGVGFAGWFIVEAGQSETLQGGNVVVETFSKKTVTVEASFTKDVDSTLKFVADTSKETTNKWLKFESQNKENLSISLDLKVTNYSQLAALTFDYDGGTYANTTFTPSSNYADVLNTYIVEPTTRSIAGTEITTENGWTLVAATENADEYATKTVLLSYTWGSNFKLGNAAPCNPYEYYNNQSSSEALISDAQTKIGTLYNKLNGLMYQVTITPTIA